MKKILVTLFLLFLVTSYFPYFTKAQGAKWTIMVYMDADNNLEEVGIEDFLEMASVGSTPEVNIVVQFDRSSSYDSRYGDWSTTKRFYVERGMEPWPNNATQELGEMNMADPQTLIDFVDWAMTNYPADHYFLALWDHGKGWEGIAVDGADYLTTIELGDALQQIVALGNRRLDVVGNDACRMTLEIQYQLKDYADYFVGSEKDEPLDGWPYDLFLSPLAGNPSMTPFQLARTLVDAYMDRYEGISAYSVALSAVSSSSLKALRIALDEFVEELNTSLPFYSEELRKARSETERYEEAGDEYDLYHFAERVIENIQSPRVHAKARNLMGAINKSVLYERHWDNPDPINGVHAANANGISLWFPETITDLSYYDLLLSKEGKWDDFLRTYFDGIKPDVEFHVIASSLDSNTDGLNDGFVVGYWSEIEGIISIDFYLEGKLVLSHDYSTSLARWEDVNISFEEGGNYSLFFYLYDLTGKLQNVSGFSSLSIEKQFTFFGNVRNLKGLNLAGCLVTLRNARTGEEIRVTSDGTGFEMIVVYPRWFRSGDKLEILAEYEGKTIGTSFVLSHPVEYSQEITLVMDVEESRAQDLRLLYAVLGTSLALVAILVVMIILLLIRIKRMQEKQ